MPRIEFYSLEPGSRSDRFAMACQIVERLYGEDERVLILCPDPDEARHLDRLLWTFRQESFIPHGMLGEVDAELTPILIALESPLPRGQEALINLGPLLPPNWGLWDEIYEIVDNDPEVLEAGRARYRAYRQGGCEPIHQRLRLG